MLETPPVQFAPLSSAAPSYAQYHGDSPTTELTPAQEDLLRTYTQVDMLVVEQDATVLEAPVIPSDQGPSSVVAEDYPRPSIGPTAQVPYQGRPQRIRKRPPCGT